MNYLISKAFTFVMLGFACCAMGCASGAKKPDPAHEEGRNIKINSWLESEGGDLPLGEYHVMPPDKIRVIAPRIKEIDQAAAQVSTDGTVSLNLVGRINVAGLTPSEIAEKIAQKAGQFYKTDALDINVIVTEYKSQVIYIFGQVLSPGVKPFTGRDTVIKVLADAKLNELAWPQKVIIVRPSEDLNVHQRVTVDLKTMFETGSATQNFLLEEGDVVYVPPSPLAELNITFKKILFPIRPLGNLALLATGNGF